MCDKMELRRKSRLVMHEALVVELLEKKKVKKSDEGLGAVSQYFG